MAHYDRQELLYEMDRLLDIQLSDGNWDNDPYNHGMANGMILMRSLAYSSDGDYTPPFKSAPEYWKAKIPRTIRKTQRLSKFGWLHFKWGLARMITNITGLTFDFRGEHGSTRSS